MPEIGTPYATLADLKTYLDQNKGAANAAASTQYDARMNDALAAASAQIEQYTGRQFNKSTFATPRTFEITSRSTIAVDDFYDPNIVISALDSDGVTPSGYDVGRGLVPYPLSGVVDGQPGWPFYELRSQYQSFPYYGHGFTSLVTVTAKWGWSAVPATVHQACLIIAAQVFKLADAPFGVTGMANEFGGVVRVRALPQVESMLNRFISSPVMVG